MFELLDEHAAPLTPAQQDQVVDECFHCKLCYVNCPYVPGQSDWAVDFPRLMLRAGAMRHAAKEVPAKRRITDNVLGRTDLLGKLSTRIPANTAITEQTGRVPVHPLQVMARAYGIPEESS
jgi:Fe-S oxidoreductase